MYISTLRARETWKRDKWIEAFGPENGSSNFDKWSGSNEESIQLESIWDSEYQSDWETKHPDEIYPISGNQMAEEALSDEIAVALEILYSNVLEEMDDLGYSLSIVPDENLLYESILSKEQLINLPEIDHIRSYSILFSDEKNCSFNGKYVSETITGIGQTRIRLAEYITTMSEEDTVVISIEMERY